MITLILSLISLTADEIVKNVEDLLRSNNSHGIYEMQVIRPDFQRKIVFEFWDERKEDKSLVLIIEPKKDKGTVFLKSGTNLYMYIPRVRKQIRIPPSMMQNSWMGSDFTNDDIVKEYSISKDYTPEIISQKGDTVTLKLIPKPDREILWSYVKFKVLLPKYPLEAIYYDEDESPVRKVSFKDYKNIRGRKLPSVWELEVLYKKGNKTILILKDIQFDVPFPSGLFSLQNLDKISKKAFK